MPDVSLSFPAAVLLHAIDPPQKPKNLYIHAVEDVVNAFQTERTSKLSSAGLVRRWNPSLLSYFVRQLLSRFHLTCHQKHISSIKPHLLLDCLGV